MYRVGVEENMTKREARAELVNLALERFNDLEGGVEGPNGRPCTIEVTVKLREVEADHLAAGAIHEHLDAIGGAP